VSEREREEGVLRERFRELRAEVRAQGTPAFGPMLERARVEAAERPALGLVHGDAPGGRPARPSRLIRRGAWTSALLAAGVAGLLLVARASSGDEDREFERLVGAYASLAAGGAWRSPTSGLLEVPGAELLRSVPRLGAPSRSLEDFASGASEAGDPPEEERR
jgi:hypothetical protein